MEKEYLPTVRAPLSAGAIVYIKNGNEIMILLLEQSNKFYKRTGKNAAKRVIDVGPCGRLEYGENLIKAARREMKQETNLDLSIDQSFKGSVSYTFDGIAERGRLKGRKAHIRRVRIYFMARAYDKDLVNLRVSEEHSRYIWMPMEQAIRSKLLRNPQKALLRKLQSRLAAIN